MPVLLTLARSTLAMDLDLSEMLDGSRPCFDRTPRGSSRHGPGGANIHIGICSLATSGGRASASGPLLKRGTTRARPLRDMNIDGTIHTPTTTATSRHLHVGPARVPGTHPHLSVALRVYWDAVSGQANSLNSLNSA